MIFFNWLWSLIISVFGFHKPQICTLDTNQYVQCFQSMSDFGKFDENVRAWAFYNEKVINETGWAQLEIITNPNIPDRDQAFAAGFIEGYLTCNQIEQHWFNTFEPIYSNVKYREKINEFIGSNNDFMKQMIKDKSTIDPYWHQVDLIYEQIEGMEKGYKEGDDSKEKLQVNMLWMSLEIELLGDIPNKLLNNSIDPSGTDRCSAIIKPLPDGSDLYVAHSTWREYKSMIRIIKKYNFTYNETSPRNETTPAKVPVQSIAFSSYPGVVYSIDDYYITSAKLAIQSTSNSPENSSAMQITLKPGNSVFDFVKSMVANRLATNGKQWTDLFVRYESGIYANQFMVIDYKKFKPGTKVDQLEDGLLWVVETVPGLTHAEDVTKLVREEGYWASYNSPYFKDVREASGFTKLQTQIGDYYSHENNPRAQIFKREHHDVKDMKSLYFLMRFNDFKNDLLSTCALYELSCSPPYSAKFAIAARNDLNDPNGTYQIDIIGYHLSGAIDVKMTNYQLMKDLHLYAESGPTHTQQPVFQWSKVNDNQIRHIGQTDKFDFPTIAINWLPEESEKIEL